MDEWIELDAMEIRQEERSARPQEPPTPRNMLGKQKIKRGNECLAHVTYWMVIILGFSHFTFLGEGFWGASQYALIQALRKKKISYLANYITDVLHPMKMRLLS